MDIEKVHKKVQKDIDAYENMRKCQVKRQE
jgi:hypothetical protein